MVHTRWMADWLHLPEMNWGMMRGVYIWIVRGACIVMRGESIDEHEHGQA